MTGGAEIAAGAPPDRAAAEALDAADPLAGFREAFALPGGVVYLDGNSLGALPRATLGRIAGTVAGEWGEDLIRAWNRHGWIDMPIRVGDKIARLIGAAPGEVAVADSTSVNLFKLLAAALRLRPDRRVILSEADNFPTDLYIAEGLIDLLGGRHELRLVAGAEMAGAVDESVAVVLATHVNYRTGALHDMAGLTAAAHRAGALMLWDLSHSTGAVPVDLSAVGADLAVGCGYKYLNGGPGAPAFLYVARRLQDEIRPPLAGWMGHAAPFDFDAAYRPAEGIRRQLCGTPAILALAALEVGVDLVARADMAAVRRKSISLTDFFIRAVEAECAGLGFEIASPREADRRGSQVALRHPEGWPIMQALIARGVIGDFRAPDILRFGFAPLYVRHVDAFEAAVALGEIARSGEWDRPEYRVRAKVT